MLQELGSSQMVSKSKKEFWKNNLLQQQTFVYRAAPDPLTAQQEPAEPRAQLANIRESFWSELGDPAQEWFSRSSLWNEAGQLLQTLGDGTVLRELVMHCSKSPSYLSCATNSVYYLIYFCLGWVYCFREKLQSLYLKYWNQLTNYLIVV